MGQWLIIAGCILILLGVLVLVAPWLVNWFGRLPGDVRIDSGRTKVFIPLASCILVSIIVTIVLNVLARWFRH